MIFVITDTSKTLYDFRVVSNGQFIDLPIG